VTFLHSDGEGMASRRRVAAPRGDPQRRGPTAGLTTTRASQRALRCPGLLGHDVTPAAARAFEGKPAQPVRQLGRRDQRRRPATRGARSGPATTERSARTALRRRAFRERPDRSGRTAGGRSWNGPRRRRPRRGAPGVPRGEPMTRRAECSARLRRQSKTARPPSQKGAPVERTVPCPAYSCQGDFNRRRHCKTCCGGGWVYASDHRPLEEWAAQWDARQKRQAQARQAQAQAAAQQAAARAARPPWQRLTDWLTGN
jgi:hypothetical protein